MIRWLEQLGNNILPTLHNHLRSNLIQILPECITATLDDLIENIFGDMRAGEVLNKAILTPLNEECHLIYERVLNRIDSPEMNYLVIDDIVSDDPEERNLYLIKFLNSLTPSGLP
ncbi:hypothetical protein QE152_g13072 [Popillia japonica]|uniref:DNA helicase n=1 Tax=Popillia japonica TaxID=7064 RepID=A0AAW1LB37_POPJA